MQGSLGADICEAIWIFFIDAGGFPETLQCNYDTRLFGGKASALLHSHRTCIRAALPHCQDRNSKVEQKW